MAAKLQRLFSSLTLLGVFTVTCVIIFLFLNQSPTSTSIRKNFRAGESNKLAWIFKKREETQRLPGINGTNSSRESILSPDEQPPLIPCPVHPPRLVGPLLIEFNFKRTFDEVRQLYNSSIQHGGRYKPPDCVAQQKVAIIIPFRHRHEHLKHWLFYLYAILIRQQPDVGVYVINQYGEGTFNRAKLMNAGVFEALKEYDYDCFVFSDVDLVPMDDRNLYRCFDNPRHLAVAMDKFQFQLPYNTFFGGVSSLSKEQFWKINGFPNTYWGWGGEDDDIYRRIYYRGMSISRPDSVIGKYRMIRHNRDLHNEPNPKNPDKLDSTKWAMDKDGINTLHYTVKSIEKDLLYTLITVDIDAPTS